MVGNEPERLAALAHYGKRLDQMLEALAHRQADEPLPQDAAGMPWLTPVSTLSRAALAERWDPTPQPR